MTSSPPPVSLRVLTMNAHKGFAFMSRRFVLHELREAVRAVGADVVFLQEVHGSHLGHSKKVGRWPSAPQYEFLADEIWPAFAYGRNAVYPSGDHGNALLSKFPIVAYENRDVSITGHEERGMLHCTLQLPGREMPLHAICVHLGLKDAHRKRQLDLLGEIIREHVPEGAPLLVAGDFNDWQRRAHRVLQRGAGLREVFVNAHGRAAKTFPARFPLFQLDRIYVRNTRADTPLRLPRHPWSRLSDHAPLAAEISL
ncbi:MAG: endonuclease/exonuclease/phosphatase family protein [Rhizobiales bacterium]|nr:endonuclease/exonuclease/phosphatase family protein [Rhizobacter sp.]